MLRLHLIGRDIRVLGPGCRYVVWVQGCHQRCPGCASPESRPLDGGYLMPIRKLAEDILRQTQIDGITISGGEPFLQASELARLIEEVRKTRDLGVIVYTGYVYEELLAHPLPGTEALLAQADLLIDGPYMDQLNDNGTLRGSSNQRAIPLTPRYRDALGEYGSSAGRQTEIMVTTEGMRMAGIPPKGFIETLRGTKAADDGSC